MTKYNMDFIKNFCNNIGAKLLSTEYKSIKDNLLFKCPECNNEYYRSFDNMLNRKNPLCQSCSKRRAQTKRLKYEDVKDFIESCGCKLISKNYTNCDSPLEIQCRCGNRYTRTFYKFKNGHTDCPACSMR